MSDSAPSPLPVYASHVVQRAVAAQFAARPTVAVDTHVFRVANRTGDRKSVV